jgi:hypothetical protein
MASFKTIKTRWKADTPKFFKEVKNLSITLGASATAVWVTNESMSLDLHVYILDVCKYLIAISVAMGVTSQLTRANPNDIDEH